ncbi:MAG: hypothetical protein QXV73_04865 [Candidatus Micrarchaeia archaeon]
MDYINPKKIRQYIDNLIQKGEGFDLIEKKLKTILKFLSWAFQKGYIKEENFKQAKEEVDNFLNSQQEEITYKQAVVPQIEDFEKAIYAGEKKTEGIFGEISLRFHLQTYKIKSFLLGILKRLSPFSFKKIIPSKKYSNFEFRISNLTLYHYLGFLALILFISLLGAGIYNRFFIKHERTLAYPTSLTRAGRLLSFQGRLTDSLGNPISTATNVTFKLYNVPSGGSALYTAGACSITPDQDGVFSVLIGGSGYSPTPPQQVCGSEIPASIFTENANVYLGVTVGADEEMTPRQQIANVGYAINAETLQGFPPGTSINNIPFINNDGDLLIAVATPGIRSTYTSADFTISSAKTAIIQSAGTGEVILQATGSGALKLRTGGNTDANNRLTISNSGTVAIPSLSTGIVQTNASGELSSVLGTSGYIPKWTTTGLSTTSNIYENLAGNIGIGTTTPTAKLDISGSASLSGILAFRGTTDPKIDILNGENFGIRTSVGGDNGLTERLTLLNDGRIGINTISPHSSALLELSSTNKGFLAPRMNQTQRDAISSPATGLLIFNITTNKFNVYDGTNWSEIGGNTLWSSLLDPTANLTLNHSTYTTTFNSSVTTGTFFTINANSLTSGKGLYLSSTSTGLNTGSLLSIDWSPSSATSASGDLVKINIGSNGDVGNILNITDNNSTIFRVSETQIESAVPHVFTSSGDVSMAYDLIFTNQTSSNIKTYGPFTIDVGESFESNDLTLKTYNKGAVVVDSESLLALNSATVSSQLAVGTQTPSSIGGFYLTNSQTFGKALAILNQTENQDILTASSSGTPKLTITNSGNLQFHQASTITTTTGTLTLAPTSSNLQFFSSSNYITPSGNLVIAGNLTVPGTTTLNNQTYTWPSSTVNNGFLQYTSGGQLVWTTISATSLKWNALTDPDDNLTLNHSTYTTTFNSSVTTGTFFTINANSLTSGKGLYLSSTSTELTGNLAEFVLSGSNAGNTGNVVRIAQTGTSSSAVPLMVTNLGTGLSFRVNDETGDNDSTPFVIDSSGNVGIGTTSPLTKLDINDSLDPILRIAAAGSNSNVYINLNSRLGGSDRLAQIYSDWEGGLNFKSFSGVSTKFLDGSDVNLVIEGSGNVGIGTTSPLEKLDISGNATISGNLTFSGERTIASRAFNQLTIGDSQTGDILFSPGTGKQVRFFSSSNYINSSGNLVIAGNLTVPGTTTLNNQTYTWPSSTVNNGFLQYTSGGQLVWTTNISATSLKWNALTDPDDNLTLNHSTYTTTFNSSVTTGTFFTINANSLTSGKAFTMNVDALTSGNALSIISQSTSLTSTGSLLQIFHDPASSGGSGNLLSLETNSNSSAIPLIINNLGSGFSFRVNDETNDSSPFIIDSDGNVGIGLTNISANFKLHVIGDIRASNFKDNENTDYYLDPANTGTSLKTRAEIDIGTNIKIGSMLASGVNPEIDAGSRSIILKSSNDVAVCVGDTDCTGKLDAGTVDPPYTINGKKYATYLSSMTGVKEETTGSISLTTFNPQLNAYQYVIDFNNQEEGSDLWLFSKTTNLRKNMDKMTVLLTPNKNTRVWYKIDKEKFALYLYATTPTTISYRLTAPRFDYEKWSNRNDGGSTGFIINDPDQPSLLTLDNFGNLSPSEIKIVSQKYNPSSQTTNFNLLFENLNQLNYSLTNISQELVENLSTIKQLFSEKITAGLISAENIIVKNLLVSKNIIAENLNLTTQNLTIAGKTISQYIDEKIQNFLNANSYLLTTNEKIISPIVETEEIQFKNQNAKIKMQNDNGELEIVDNQNQPIAQFQTATKTTFLTGAVEIKSDESKGKLAQIILKGLEGKQAVVIDAQGNASFSGSLTAQSLQTQTATIEGTLISQEVQSSNLKTKSLESQQATIEGKLVAKEIESENINSLTRELANTQTDINEIQKLLAEIKNQPIPDITNQTNLSNTANLTNLNNPTNFENLTVTGSTNLYNATVSNSLVVGNLLLENDKILALSWELKLSALARINLFDGAVTIAKDGTITTKGTIIAQGGIQTSRIILDKDNPLQITNNSGKTLASIDASGSAFFRSLSLEKFTPATPSALIVSPMENFNKRGIFAPAIETASASAGIGILPENQQEVVIYNNNVRENSLIYLTPNSSIANYQLSVIEKNSCKALNSNCQPYFKVVVPTKNHPEIKFDWLIIN